MTVDLDNLASEAFCYVSTTGRVSGKPHEIEIWFGRNDGTLYLLSGGGDRSDWVKNIRKMPSVRVRINTATFPGTARVVTAEDEDALARRLLLDKYAPDNAGDLTDWGRIALPIAIDLAV